MMKNRAVIMFVIAQVVLAKWRDERTGTTRKNACNRETMMKIRVVITFITAQAASAKWHASGRSMNMVVEDRAIRHNRNTVKKQFVQDGNTSQSFVEHNERD